MVRKNWKSNVEIVPRLDKVRRVKALNAQEICNRESTEIISSCT